MKTLKIFMLLALGSFAVNAQDLNQNEVPNDVISAFENEYPNASDIEWEKSGDNFNVEFDLNRSDHEIWYSASGEMVKLEKEIKKDDLPASVREALENEYANFRVEDAEMRKEGNATTYKVDMEDGTKEKNVLFDASGEVINEWGD